MFFQKNDNGNEEKGANTKEQERVKMLKRGNIQNEVRIVSTRKRNEQVMNFQARQ
jgi:hypothetical protein